MRTVAAFVLILASSTLSAASAASEPRSLRALFHPEIATETCFSKGEKTDGMNKICFYSCPSGEAAITVSAVSLCPVSINR